MNEGKKVKAAVGRGEGRARDRGREWERTGLQSGFRAWFTEGETGSLARSLDLISRKSGAWLDPTFCASTSSRTCSPAKTRLTERRPGDRTRAWLRDAKQKLHFK